MDIRVRMPLNKKGDNVFLDFPSLNEQLFTVGVIGLILIFVFGLGMYVATKNKDIFLFLAGIGTVAAVYIYGCRYKYLFNIRTKQIVKEGIICFIPFSKVICNFKDVAVIGVRGYCAGSKKRRRSIFDNEAHPEDLYFKYHLVFVTKKRPTKFIFIASTLGISDSLTLGDLNDIGSDLAELTETEFIAGKNGMNLKAINSIDGVKYELRQIYRNSIEEWLDNP